ncbi:hypothetical protein BDR22DRAFT_801286 [Usnea florida]
MSLTVKHLNGDTTFLLTFSPTESSLHTPPPPQYQQPPGTFSILVDPWLSGPTTMWHPKFLLSKHTTPSCIPHLSHIPEPNVVLISQEKPDHCHEATLRQLDPTSPITTILAEPSAAKKIRGMKFFNPDMVHSLRPFSEKKPDSVIRFFIPPIVPGGTPGEATISFMPAKMDVAKVHNAIGVTYRPPSSAYIPLPPQNPPMTPPESPTSVTSTSRIHAEKALSFIYSPHGVNYSLIRAYASTHLVSVAALPLTLLLHSFDRVENPWYMGGNVAAGSPGGVEIAQNLMAKCWISAHDEDKDNTGLSVISVKTRKYKTEEVRAMLRQELGSNVNVANLGPGAEMVLKA